MTCAAAGAGPDTAIGTLCTDEWTAGQANAVSNALMNTVSSATVDATRDQGDGSGAWIGLGRRAAPDPSSQTGPPGTGEVCVAMPTLQKRTVVRFIFQGRVPGAGRQERTFVLD
ncbi:hypothetical protein Raf01_79480 [Rugosimonospora africana]|uniref:Uncharacterized protein n=1 Tax=Rugosimonospora africana TaxID=556532 RepID=A0A8J3R489_9ACTN|nr:hypothetical protein Raf01_79480 [Rugosimonospora africana]